MKKLKTRLNLGMSTTIHPQTHFSSHFAVCIYKIKRYTAIALPTVVYLCGTWSLMLWEEHWMPQFKNRVLRKVTGAKTEGIGCWRQLYEELHDLYSPPILLG
jgi:hypothetical protein